MITNSISVFEVLTDPGADAADAPQVYLSGGVRTPSDALVGTASPTRPSTPSGWTAHISVYTGSIRRRGLTTPNIAEAQTNRTLIGIGAQLTVLADHTKYREVGTNVFARMRRVDNLIVDDGLAVVDRGIIEMHVGRADHRHGDATAMTDLATRWPLADGRELSVVLAAGAHAGAGARQAPAA